MTEDYFIFDEEHMELVGELSKKRYKLGQKVLVEVAGTDKLTRTVDFKLNKCFLDAAFSHTDRFHLCAKQFDSCLILILYKIIMVCLFIVGNQFDGQFMGAISGVTNWGLYVELPNTVEGLVGYNN